MKTKKTSAPVKHPLFKVSRGDLSGHLWIIAKTTSEALTQAERIWEMKGARPASAVEIRQEGSVDYIPALPKPHIEV